MVTNSTRKRFTFQAKNENGDNIPVVGYVIAWSYSQKEYSMLEVEQVWKKNTLDTTNLTKGQQRISAVLRALNKAKEKQLLREIEDTPTFTRFQFTAESLSEDTTGSKFIKFEASDFITFDKTNDSLVCNNPDKQNHLNSLLKKCSETWSNADITRYTKQLFKGKGIISLRDRGGMEFIPAIHQELVMNVFKAFSEMDSKGTFTLLELPDLNFTKQSIATNFENDMEEKITKLSEKLKKLQENKEDGDKKIHGKTMNSTIEDIGEMVKDLEMYSDLTDLKLDKAKGLIQQGQEIFKKFLMGEKI